MADAEKYQLSKSFCTFILLQCCDRCCKTNVCCGIFDFLLHYNVVDALIMKTRPIPVSRAEIILQNALKSKLCRRDRPGSLSAIKPPAAAKENRGINKRKAWRCLLFNSVRVFYILPYICQPFKLKLLLYFDL